MAKSQFLSSTSFVALIVKKLDDNQCQNPYLEHDLHEQPFHDPIGVLNTYKDREVQKPSKHDLYHETEEN
jgi:hypothetical protein